MNVQVDGDMQDVVGYYKNSDDADDDEHDDIACM